MNLDKLDEALTKLGPLVDNRACIDGFKEVFEAARAFRDQERAKRPSVDLAELATTIRAIRVEWMKEGASENDKWMRTMPRAAHLLDVLRTEVVPALERAADDRRPGIYSSESLKLLTALGLR